MLVDTALERTEAELSSAVLTSAWKPSAWKPSGEWPVFKSELEAARGSVGPLSYSEQVTTLEDEDHCSDAMKENGVVDLVMVQQKLTSTKRSLYGGSAKQHRQVDVDETDYGTNIGTDDDQTDIFVMSDADKVEE